MNNSQTADMFLDSLVDVPILNISAEEKAEFQAINWADILLLDDED